MRNIFAVCALVSSMMLANTFATTNNALQAGTVVSVQSGKTSSVNDGNSSDAPLRVDSYPYNIGIKVGGVVYQASYMSAFEESAIFSANQAVQASRKGNILYVTLPGNRTVPMAIEGRSE